jgi:Hpt domain
MVDPADVKAAVKVRFYRFRNRLKEKAAGQGGGDAVMEFDAAALAKAEELLSQASEDYPDWALKSVAELAALHKKCVEGPDQHRDSFERIRRVAHDLKGQGATFGYPLVTSVAQSLHRFVSPNDNASEAQMEIIKSHVDAMRVILKDKVKGDGGQVGPVLLTGLNNAIKKHGGTP